MTNEMTEQEWMALGRRAVACKGWRWMAGMLCSGEHYDLLTYEDSTTPRSTDEKIRLQRTKHGHAYISDDCGWVPGDESWPDLRDPATLGCVLALVREAWGQPGLYALRIGGELWTVSHDRWKHKPYIVGERTAITEAEALVTALEQAP